MEKKQCHFLPVLLVLPFIFLPMIVWAELSVPAPQKYMSWKGAVSFQKKEIIKLVETQKEWSELWKNAFNQRAPAVDFETSVVA